MKKLITLALEHDDLPPGSPKTLWIGQVSKKQLTTLKPMKITWNDVFGVYDFCDAYPEVRGQEAPKVLEAESRGFCDEGFTGEGVFTGRFGRTLSYVSKSKKRVAAWLKLAKSKLQSSRSGWDQLKKVKTS